MRAVHSFEISGTISLAEYNIPAEICLHHHCRQNFKSSNVSILTAISPKPVYLR
jgi:hypothetical protein